MKPSFKFLNVRPSQCGFRGVGGRLGSTVIYPRQHGDDERVGSISVRSGWQSYMTLWRHPFARLTYIHTQIAFWGRQGATRQLRSDMHRAVGRLHPQYLDGTLINRPSYRAPPEPPLDYPSGSQRGERKRERESRP